MEKVISAEELGHRQPTIPGSPVDPKDFDTTSTEITGSSGRTEVSPSLQEHLWAIVLAGGEGERLRPLTEKWLGCHCPKQYCTFVGNRSMLEHTLERTCQLVSPERVLTVVSCEHMKWLETSVVTSIPGRLIQQPANLDTGPGIFLPATYILEEDPAAEILIFPSDHFVFPQERFLSHVAQLVALANRFSGQIVMLGVKPDRAEADYGWIEPGQKCALSTTNDPRGAATWVAAFREKPSLDEAIRFLEKGYLWNTMIMAVKVKTLWQLGQQYLPEMMELFEPLRLTLSNKTVKDNPEAALSALYQNLRPQNFSSGLLQRAAKHTIVAAMDDVDWDDWGRPERIVDSLSRIGRRPAFTIESLTSGGDTDVQNRASANA